MKHSKKFTAFRALVDRRKRYGLEEAVKILKTNKYSKFDESVEVAVRLGVDPKQDRKSVV
jgi:large subunit ribosomal protein L1